MRLLLAITTAFTVGYITQARTADLFHTTPEVPAADQPGFCRHWYEDFRQVSHQILDGLRHLDAIKLNILNRQGRHAMLDRQREYIALEESNLSKLYAHGERCLEADAFHELTSLSEDALATLRRDYLKSSSAVDTLDRLEMKPQPPTYYYDPPSSITTTRKTETKTRAWIGPNNASPPGCGGLDAAHCF
jgi:hypothetical protein